jgi:hypothetical protein
MGIFTDPVFKKREAWGYIWVLLVRGCSWTSWVFLSVAVMKFANNEVGCSDKGYEIAFNTTMNRTQTEEEAEISDIDCTGKLTAYGKLMTPGTIVPYFTSIGIIFTVILSPIFGAIVDR